MLSGDHVGQPDSTQLNSTTPVTTAPDALFTELASWVALSWVESGRASS